MGVDADPLAASGGGAPGGEAPEGVPSDGQRPVGVGVWIRWAVVAIAAGLLAWAIVRYRGAIADSWSSIGALAFLVSGAAALVALGANALSWRAVVRAVGLRSTRREAARVFFISQAGKYVPGSVWPVVAQVEFARDNGVDRVRALVGSLGAMVVGVVTAGVIGAVGTTVFVPGALAAYWWVLPIAAALAVVLVPSMMRGIVARAMRMRGGGGEAPEIAGRDLAAAILWSAAMWLLLGVHAWILLRQIAPGPSTSWPLATGVMALAWLVGFVVVLAPAGAGAREAAFVFLLGAVATAPQAIGFALASRVLMTLADAVALVIGLALRRSKGPRRRNGPERRTGRGRAART
jgi:uncharacterized membrane protein YbhN (UPF0104 family)